MKKIIFLFFLSYPFLAVSDLSKASAFSFDLESALTLSQNNLLESSKGWSVQIPYTEVSFDSHFSTNSSFKIQFDFSYFYGEWSYFLDELFVEHEKEQFIPVRFKLGYFSYPLSYVEKNTGIFFSKTSIQKNLFPYGYKDAGISLSAKLGDRFFIEMSWQVDAKKRISSKNLLSSLTTSFFYKNTNREVFLSYLQKDFFLKGDMKALGFGGDIFFLFESWNINLQGEFWNIRRSEPFQNILTYYLYPSLSWKILSFGLFFGGTQHRLQKDKSYVLEYILKGAIQLSDHVSFTIEKNKKWDSLILEDALAFSIKTAFSI